MRMRGSVLAFGLALLAGSAARAGAPGEARVDTGALKGVVAADGVVSFKGVPFAAPPVGEGRWRPPAPAAAWRGVRAASAFGPACPQPVAWMGRDKEPTAEDCLTLNVWTPADHANPLPVMVWIYGGGWVSGSGSKPYYDGAAFARRGVVLVTLNYRLGALGYFAHPALTAEAGPTAPLANYGQMDQIAALRWVQNNIAAFGGDPAKVTVFGESAGAGSILSLMTTPSAKGLFAQAIVESAPGWTRPKTLAAAQAEGVALAKSAGAPAAATAAQLRALPPEKLADVGEGTGVVVDGRLVPESVERAFGSGHAQVVPMVIGTNTDEGSLVEHDYPGAADAVLHALSPEQLKAVREAYGADAPDEATLKRLLFSDFVFGAPARWTAALASRRAPAFLYRFGYVAEPLAGHVRGAKHGWEVPYVFDNLDHAPLNPTPADRAMAARVNACWTDFARTGVPCAAGVWPTYDPASDRLLEWTEAGPVARAGYRKAIFDRLHAIIAERWKAARSPVPPSPLTSDH